MKAKPGIKHMSLEGELVLNRLGNKSRLVKEVQIAKQS